MSEQTIPRWPVITATARADGTGEVEFTPSTRHPLDATDLTGARAAISEEVASYAREKLGRPVRLRVVDPDGTWWLAVHPDGNVSQLEDQESAPSPEDGPDEEAMAAGNGHHAASAGLAPAPQMRVVEDPAVHLTHASEREYDVPAPQSLPARTVNRQALHARRVSPFAGLVNRVNDRLKDPEQREEEALDQQFGRRYLVTDTNLAVVVSPKGGPGKTTVAVVIGDALSSRLLNQRIGAIDFNPGGGALEAVATEDRSARFSLLQLYRDRDHVRSHAQLQPYVASLHSGLDLLAVPPDPALALSIRPEHYESLFDEVLVPNYNVLLLDTSPDITSPVTQLALQRGTQMIIVLEQGYVSSGVVVRSLRYLLEQPAAGPGGSRAIVVINRVLSDPRAGRLEELRDEIRKSHSGPIIEIPWDLDLRAEIDAGTYTLDRVRRRSTRLPLKRLALHVAENFI
jgi:MinD-like ATPase involved in chromosome partitioning or flagellar assembly